MARTTKTGLKSNNVLIQDGASWEDIFDINVSELTYITRANFLVQIKGNEQYRWVEAMYTGTDALDTDLGSALDNLPNGSIIWAPLITTAAVYVKTASSTWKYQAINT